jgi:catechol 2,3-dioxygenase-like lactoylglutathione lyase family enzyme
MIKRVHHVQITIPKGEEARAREFYCGVLGLVEVPKPESLAGRGGFWMQLGEMQVHVGTENIKERAESKAHVAYLVDDLNDWRTRLTERGVDVIDGIPIPGYDRFEFRDPFGNRVEMLQVSDI